MARESIRSGAAVRRRLLPWYRRARRDLPWRRTQDPYAIWVSEIMLQQTRVAAVIPYYERFLRRFPDVETLARARLTTVLAHWSGLGYYRRARMLHTAAKRVAREGWPRSATALRALPGIGAYTAAAIASIAFGEAAAVVDGNVERVLSRLEARGEAGRWIADLAQSWITPRAPADFNQAMMELGATICLPRAPDCPRCPLNALCAGSADAERYPSPKRRPKIIAECRSVRLARRKGSIFLRRIEAGRLEGMWDLPPARSGAVLARVRHAILDRRYEILVRAGAATGAGDWFDARARRRIPLATAARKCIDAVSRIGTTRPGSG